MNFSKTLLLLFTILLFNQHLFAQKKRKVKPVFFGKIQGAFLVDNFIADLNTSFTYINLGIRKITGKKVREIGIESYYYNQEHTNWRQSWYTS